MRLRALTGPFGLGACRDVAAPATVRFAPPPAYAQWWAMTGACAGRTGDFATYTWYVVPGNAIPEGRAGDVAAYADVVARRVVFASRWKGDGPTVRHEMLHTLLGPAYASGDLARQHPPAYFQGRCAGVVGCPEVGCRDAGPAPVTAPADAAMLPVSALDVRVDLLPAPVSRTGADRVLSLVVRVTNPSAGPAWVPLETTPDLPAPWVHEYGFRIVPAGQRVPITDLAQSDSAGMVTSDSARRVPFAAGQTRPWVIDLPASLYPAGDYLAVGVFNTRQVWTSLTVAP